MQFEPRAESGAGLGSSGSGIHMLPTGRRLRTLAKRRARQDEIVASSGRSTSWPLSRHSLMPPSKS